LTGGQHEGRETHRQRNRHHEKKNAEKRKAAKLTGRPPADMDGGTDMRKLDMGESRVHCYELLQKDQVLRELGGP